MHGDRAGELLHVFCIFEDLCAPCVATCVRRWYASETAAPDVARDLDLGPVAQLHVELPADAGLDSSR